MLPPRHPRVLVRVTGWQLMTAELTYRQTRKTISQRRIDQIKIFLHYNLQPRRLLLLNELAES